MDDENDILDGLDIDLDDDSFDAFEMELGGTGGGERSPVGRAKKYASEGIKGAGPEVAKKIADQVGQAIPEASALVGEAASVGRDLGQMKREVVAEITPAINNLKTAAQRALPRAEKILPGKIYDKLERVLAVQEEAESAESRLRREREVAITDTVGGIYDIQMQLQRASEEQRAADRIVDTSIADQRHQDQMTGTSQMIQHLQFQENFTRSVLLADMKKTMELRMRQLHVSQDTLGMLKGLVKVTEQGLDDIRFNTGLPDIQKQRKMESLKAEQRRKLAGTISSKMSNYGKLMVENVRSKFMTPFVESMTNIGDLVESGMSGADMIADMQETGMDTNELVAGMAGTGIGGKLGTMLGKKLIKKHPALVDFMNDYLAGGKERAILKLQEMKDDYGGDSKLIQSLLDVLPDLERNTIAAENFLEQQDQTRGFGRPESIALTKIIPSILTELLHVNERGFFGDSPGRMAWDMTQGELVRETVAQQRFRDNMFGTVDQRAAKRMDSVTTTRAILGQKTTQEDLESGFDQYFEDIASVFDNLAQNERGFKPSEFKNFLDGGADVSIMTPYLEKALYKIDPDRVATVVQLLVDAMYSSDSDVNKLAVKDMNLQVIARMKDDKHVEKLERYMREYGDRNILGDLVDATGKVDDKKIQEARRSTFTTTDVARIRSDSENKTLALNDKYDRYAEMAESDRIANINSRATKFIADGLQGGSVTHDKDYLYADMGRKPGTPELTDKYTSVRKARQIPGPVEYNTPTSLPAPIAEAFDPSGIIGEIRKFGKKVLKKLNEIGSVGSGTDDKLQNEVERFHNSFNDYAGDGRKHFKAVLKHQTATSQYYKSSIDAFNKMDFTSLKESLDKIPANLKETMSATIRDIAKQGRFGFGRVGRTLGAGIRRGGGLAASGVETVWKMSSALAKPGADIIGALGKGGIDLGAAAGKTGIETLGKLARLGIDTTRGATKFLFKNLLGSEKSDDDKIFTSIYRRGKIDPGSPLVSVRQQRDGVAVFEDGSRIKRSSEIQEPVFHRDTKEPLITKEDLEHGLVDSDGRPLQKHGAGILRTVSSGALKFGRFASTVAGKLVGGASSMFGFYGDMLKTAGAGIKKGAGLFGNTIGRVIGLDGLSSLTNSNFNKGIDRLVTTEEKILAILEKIDGKIKGSVAGDTDGDGYAENSYWDKMNDKKETSGSDDSTGSSSSESTITKERRERRERNSRVKEALKERARKAAASTFDPKKKGVLGKIGRWGKKIVGSRIVQTVAGVAGTNAASAAMAGSGAAAAGAGATATAAAGTAAAGAGATAAGGGIVAGVTGTLAAIPVAGWIALGAAAVVGGGYMYYRHRKKKGRRQLLTKFRMKFYQVPDGKVDETEDLEERAQAYLTQEKPALNNAELREFAKSFGLDPKDPKALGIFVAWYSERFLPIYTVWVRLLKQNNIEPDEIHKHDPEGKTIIRLRKAFMRLAAPIARESKHLHLGITIERDKRKKLAKVYNPEAKGDTAKDKQEQNKAAAAAMDMTKGKKPKLVAPAPTEVIGSERKRANRKKYLIKDDPETFWGKVKNWIKGHEGLRLDNYKDTQGYDTIGYGHLNTEGYTSISKQQAEALFEADFAEHMNEASDVPGYADLDPVRKAGLVNMVFNMGKNKVLGFRNMLSALVNENYEAAGRHLMDSAYASQVGDRAKDVKRVLETGNPDAIKATPVKQPKSLGDSMDLDVARGAKPSAAPLQASKPATQPSPTTNNTPAQKAKDPIPVTIAASGPQLTQDDRVASAITKSSSEQTQSLQRTEGLMSRLVGVMEQAFGSNGSFEGLRADLKTAAKEGGSYNPRDPQQNAPSGGGQGVAGRSQMRPIVPTRAKSALV